MKRNSLDTIAREFIEQLIAAVLDEKGNYIFVSQHWQDWFGKKAEEVLGHNVLEIVQDSHAMEVLRTGEPLSVQRVMSRDTPIFTSYLPRRNKDGKVCGVFLYVIVDGIANARDMIRQVEVMVNEVDYYKEELSRERGARYGPDSIIGSSPAILQMKSQIIQAAKSSSTVLIEGETGSGKELVAHSIHALSARRAANFVRVNCSAIPAELMESELFGYSAGAFTGALKKGKVGRFELADGGSIFLDEVNLLTPTIQPKFLRVLQEMEIDPVGSDHPRAVDVRVIAATNVPLENLVRERKFRNDLYWRLNVIRIQTPPLRERMEDIPALTENIIQRLNTQLGMAVRGVSKGVLDLFMEYTWPGNVRELQNAIESAMNMAQTPILQVQDFSPLVQRINAGRFRMLSGDEGSSLKNFKQDFEREVLMGALETCGWNKAKTARMLGISRTTLYKKLEQYGLVANVAKMENH